MYRKFSNRQKRFLFIRSKGKCVNCKCELNKNFHADHIIPFSKNGKTILANGQALCPRCNIKKSNKL
tara:strand:+ start:360 stop:560 length:201 start_codon:yes stop_codon:yes gene_type:complete